MVSRKNFMRSISSRIRLNFYLACTLALVGLVTPDRTSVLFAADWKFKITQAVDLRQEAFTGRVYIFFQKTDKGEPRNGMNWFHPIPCIALDVENWRSGESIQLSAGTPKLLSFPKPLGDLDLAGTSTQAVARFNPFDREIGSAAGNGYGPAVKLGDSAETPIEIAIDKLIPSAPFPDSDTCKELAVKSTLLSAFHDRNVTLRCAVQRPASYDTLPARRYPVILEVPGFGGTHADAARRRPVQEMNQDGVEFIRVTLDPSCPLGHHVFADSANNGPVGRALIEELIPALDREYRTVPAATARFLTGHSSGGWSTLWLQTAYPDSFGGTWSTSPDPVDFQDFQRVNIYQPSVNLYRDELGQPRPLARDGSKVLLWTQDFVDMETILGDGGQMRSFEAVFSPRNPQGRPKNLWERRTGAIDRTVAEAWMRYDIRLRLIQDWPTVGPRLNGKLHVFMGSEDTFYLEGATIRLKTTLADLGSDAVVEILPGKNHFNLFSNGLAQRIRKEMTDAFLKHHKP